MVYTEESDFSEKQKILAHFFQSLKEQNPVLDFSSALVCDVGGGGGVLAGLLSLHCKRVVACDVVDNHAYYEGIFLRLLKEKFLRNHHDLAYEKIEFHVADAQNLIYRDNLFDVVISTNLLEHVPSPIKVLKECVRVARAGGFIYITFDPVWTADSGSHFYHFVQEPWAHLLLETEAFCEKMLLAGAPPDAIHDFQYTLNRHSASFYRDTFSRILPELGVKAFSLESWSGCVKEQNKNHPNRFEASRRLACDPDDLLIRGFRITIVK